MLRKIIRGNMKLLDIVEPLKLEKCTKFSGEDFDVTWGYSSDLLSDVLGRAEPGSIWFTIQKHPNIVAVATLKDLTAIILTNGTKPEDQTIEKADENGIPIYSTSFSTFEACGILYGLLK